MNTIERIVALLDGCHVKLDDTIVEAKVSSPYPTPKTMGFSHRKGSELFESPPLNVFEAIDGEDIAPKRSRKSEVLGTLSSRFSELRAGKKLDHTETSRDSSRLVVESRPDVSELLAVVPPKSRHLTESLIHDYIHLAYVAHRGLHRK